MDRSITNRSVPLQKPSPIGFFALRSVSAEGRVAVAVEQRRGPLFHCLSQCLDWMDLYPINPQTLARYRQAFYTSRAKDDPIDSQLLEDCMR